MEHAINQANILESVQAKEDFASLEAYDIPGMQKTEKKLSFGKLFASIGKKALFLTSMPFYWLVFFTRIMHWFDLHFFIFVVAASIALSVLGKNWGMIHFLAK